MSQNVIELNGKRYDAVTGKMLGPSTAKAVAHAAEHQHRPTPGRVVDGFFRAPASAPAKPTAKTRRVATRSTTVARAKTAKVSSKPAKASTVAAKKLPTAVQHHAGHAHVHTPAPAVHHHKPQRSTTLMRSTVRKPDVRMKPAIKPQAPAEVAAKPASALARKRSVAQVDPSRLERAHHTPTHQAVRKFHPVHYGMATVRHTVQPAAGHVPVIPVRPQPVTLAFNPVAAAQPTPDIFEQAIKHARSHQQPPVPRRRTHHRRFVNITAGVGVLLVLIGFITYLNLPNIQLHVASFEAGFHASMPGYQPTGYALQGGVQEHGGTVSMHFVSGDSSYTITQQSSNWDSQSLLDNTLALAGTHQVVERGGRIIYIYGKGANAAWVTGNVRYDITGNASLGSEELANIAASM